MAILVLGGSFGLVVAALLAWTGRIEAKCALCETVKSGDPAAVRQALAAGVDVNERVHTLEGTRYPFEVALGRLHPPISAGSPQGAAARAIVVLLLDAGADPNAEYTVTPGAFSSGRPAIRIHPAERAAAAGDLDLMSALIAHGLDPQGRGAGMALIEAARGGQHELVGRLIDLGVDVNFRANGRDALAEAIQVDDKVLIALLEKAGARRR